MKLRHRGSQGKGFTLVELLIVVIILSILAAIVVPQFASSTTDAKYSALDSNLGALRAATELYYQQHGDYPGAKASATGTAGSATAFIEQMTMFSDAAGTTAATATATIKYGPYLKKGIPVEPVSGTNAVEVITTGTLGMTATAAKDGWKFDTKTGQLIANTAALQTR